MNILIVEDELLIAQMLKGMLIKLGYKTVYIAKNYKEAQQQLILNKNIDLAFLDINLNDIKSGIDIAYHLKSKFNIPFVYLTSYSDPKTVKEACITMPEAYLLKPFSKSTLFSTLEVIKAKKETNQSKFVFIKDGNYKIKIRLNELLYVKSEKNYLDVFTTEKRFVIRQSIDKFISDLNSTRFIKSHRSFAVNIDKIDKIVGSDMSINNQLIPLSRNYKKDILAHF